LELRVERREQQLASFRNQQKMIQDTEDFIERFRYKATKSVQVQSRIKQLDKVDRIEVDEEDTRSMNIRFPPSPRSGTVVFKAVEVSKSFGNLQVLSKVDLTIERGEKIAFVGKNGEGKTTMARILMQQLECTGEQVLGHNVKVGYFAQNQASLLNEDITALETIDQIAVGDIRTKIRDILGAFMFSGEDVDKKVKVLSGGERSRLAMIRLLLEPVNFLVLDEPTNHLDIHSKGILKKALLDFDGTLLLVSHDREFLDGLVNVVYEFKNKKIRQHLGGIYEFLQKKEIDSLRELEVNTPVRKEKKEPIKLVTNVSFEERKEINKMISKLEKQISDVEAYISKLENEIIITDIYMSDHPEKVDGDLLSKYESTKKQLDMELGKWADLNSELEGWNSKKPE
jgi:ATP-binding cassette subfamily F protein 3